MADTSPKSEFYVGYFAVPAGLRAFLQKLAPIALGLLIAAAIILAKSQRDPGNAVWEDATRTIRGVVIAKPYPMILTEDGLVLVVEPGKHGAQSRLGPVDGKAVELSGTLLRRDGRRMLELDEGPNAVKDSPAPAAPAPPPRSMGRVTLKGEIVDSKCYLGAMKPGSGKTHKECAMLCVSGGIPPVFVTRDAAGRATLYLLADPSGGPLDKAVIPFIADPVELSGELEEVAGTLRIRVNAGDIHRI